MFFYSSDAIIQMTVFFPSLHYIFTLSFRTDSFYLYFIVLRHCHSFSFNYSNSCTSCLYCTRVARWITVFFINFTHSMLTNSYRLVVIPIDHVKICTTPKPKQTKRSSRLWIKKKAHERKSTNSLGKKKCIENNTNTQPVYNMNTAYNVLHWTKRNNNNSHFGMYFSDEIILCVCVCTTWVNFNWIILIWFGNKMT